MQRNTIFFIASVSLFATGATMARQEDQPAEKVFKNIVSFRGKPARDVLPAMNFMSASLKVECNFCHNTKDYSSDEKDEKKTARKMIAMQGEINKQFFEEHQAVTCTSCHNGHSSPSRVPVLPTLNRRHADFETTIKPADLFQKYQEAVGGDLKNLTLKGVEKEDGKTTPYELIQASPDKFFINAANGRIGFDGTTTWVATPQRVSKQWGDRAVTVQRLGRAFRGPKAFARYENTRIRGREKVDGKFAIVVRGSIPADHLNEELYFDETTGLLLRVATFTDTPLGILPSYYDYGDYRKVDGVKVPFKVTLMNSIGETDAFQFKSAKANVTMDENIFKMPSP